MEFVLYFASPILSGVVRRVTMEFVLYFAALILSGLLMSYLIDAIRATDAAVAADKRNKACASFVGLMAVVLWFLKG